MSATSRAAVAMGPWNRAMICWVRAFMEPWLISPPFSMIVLNQLRYRASAWSTGLGRNSPTTVAKAVVANRKIRVTI